MITLSLLSFCLASFNWYLVVKLATEGLQNLSTSSSKPSMIISISYKECYEYA